MEAYCVKCHAKSESKDSKTSRGDRKARLAELGRTRVPLEAEMILRGVDPVTLSLVKSYLADLRSLLEEAKLTERKAFLRSFVKRVSVAGNGATIEYRLPLPTGNGSKGMRSVLPIEPFGGAGVTIGRTFELEFSLTI